MRTFIAIEISQHIKEALLNFITPCQGDNRNVKWVKPRGMHLTLKFLGEISEERIVDIQKQLQKIGSEHSVFSLHIQGLGTFPPGSKRPRVLWAGIEEPQPVIRLQKDVEESFEKIHFPREKRDFHPHLTIGRVKNPYGIDKLLSMFNNNPHTEFGRMIVKHITLFKSTLKPSGAEYTKICEASLS